MAASACDPSTGETGDLACSPATLSYELQVFLAILSQKTRRARLMTQALRAFCFSFKDSGWVPSTQIRKPEDLGLIPTTHMEEGKS